MTSRAAFLVLAQAWAAMWRMGGPRARPAVLASAGPPRKARRGAAREDDLYQLALTCEAKRRVDDADARVDIGLAEAEAGAVPGILTDIKGLPPAPVAYVPPPAIWVRCPFAAVQDLGFCFGGPTRTLLGHGLVSITYPRNGAYVILPRAMPHCTGADPYDDWVYDQILDGLRDYGASYPRAPPPPPSPGTVYAEPPCRRSPRPRANC